MEVAPLLILVVGIVTVIGLIVGFRVHAFFALIAAAIVVSLLAPGVWTEKVGRVAVAFGNTTGSIGIVIALAAVIGAAMMASGAADRIVQAFLRLLGRERGDVVLMGSGFVLAVPVFFDTVFYLLIPLARSMYRQTGRHYVKYLIAIAAGGAATHSLVPPTPGPLVIADNLGVDLGVMMMVGALVALPAAAVGLIFGAWLDRRMPIPMRETGETPPPPEEMPLPGLLAALLPILLPVVLISMLTIAQPLAAGGSAFWSALLPWVSVLGNPNFALLLAAVAALVVYVRRRRPDRAEVGEMVEHALMSGGVIILITAAGGAFGAMLKEAQIGPAIQLMFDDSAGASGLSMLVLGFGLASLLKFAQGSSTVAMITASAMMAAMLVPGSLGFHPAYLGTAIGSGALVGSWMNDSGFWIFSKMGGLTEIETLRTWTPLLIVLGVVGFLMSLLLALLMPLT